MKLRDITKKSIKKLPMKELTSLHFRIHQLYSLAKKKKDPKVKDFKFFLKEKHKIIIDEMKKRNNKIHMTNLEFLYINRGNSYID